MSKMAMIDVSATMRIKSSAARSQRRATVTPDTPASERRARVAVVLATGSPLGKRIVADVLDDLLSLGRLHPADEGGRGALGLTRRVEVEKAADGIAAILCGLQRRCDGGRSVVLLHLERADASEVRDAAVADAELVTLDRVDDRRGSGERLRGSGEVLVRKHVLLEVAVGARVVFAPVKRDGM